MSKTVHPQSCPLPVTAPAISLHCPMSRTVHPQGCQKFPVTARPFPFTAPCPGQYTHRAVRSSLLLPGHFPSLPHVQDSTPTGLSEVPCYCQAISLHCPMSRTVPPQSQSCRVFSACSRSEQFYNTAQCFAFCQGLQFLPS